MTKTNKANESHWLEWSVIPILTAIIAALITTENPLGEKLWGWLSKGDAPHASPTSTPSVRPSPSDREAFSKYVSAAKTALESMKPDLPVVFPLGVNRPLISKRETASPQGVAEAVGYLDEPSGKVKNLTPAELIQLLDRRADVLYDQLSERTTHSDTVLAVDLIAYRPQTQQFYVLSSVDASDVLRDAVNAVLNGELRENMHDTSNLPLNR